YILYKYLLPNKKFFWLLRTQCSSFSLTSQLFPGYFFNITLFACKDYNEMAHFERNYFIHFPSQSNKCFLDSQGIGMPSIKQIIGYFVKYFANPRLGTVVACLGMNNIKIFLGQHIFHFMKNVLSVVPPVNRSRRAPLHFIENFNRFTD